MSNETAILRAVHLAIGGRPDCRLFRNNVGVALHPDGARVAYGLCPGSADLIGWRSLADRARDGGASDGAVRRHRG